MLAQLTNDIITQRLWNKLQTAYVIKPSKIHKASPDKLIIANKGVVIFKVYHTTETVYVNKDLVRKYTEMLKANNIDPYNLGFMLEDYLAEKWGIEGYRLERTIN